MKTMELPPMTVAQFDQSTMATQVKSFEMVAKKFFMAVYRILVVTSPVYPQYVESLKHEH